MSGTTATEPYCNHDRSAVRDGICECGEIVGPCTECGEVASTEVNAEAMCSACASEYEADGDAQALDAIAELLSAPEWDADTLDTIAGVVRATGREIH